MGNDQACTELNKEYNALEQQLKDMQCELNRMRGNEEKYRTILETIEEGYYEVDLSGNFTFFNDAMTRIIGYSRKEMLGMNNREYSDAETARRVYQVFNKVLKTGIADKGFDWAFIRKDGTRRHVETSIALIRNDHREPIGFQGLLRDVTKRKTAEKLLLTSEEKYRTILDNIEEGYYEVDLSGNFTFFNDAMTRIIGYSRKEMLGMNNREYSDAETARRVYQVFNKVLRTGIADKGFDWTFIRKDRTKLQVETSITLLKDTNGLPVGFRGILRDVEERKKYEEMLIYAAYHDVLTGLKNRKAFYEKLEEAFINAKRYRNQIGLIYIDIDHFKLVNDSFGHETGDLLLVEISRRLTNCIRESDFIYRIGGDEFVIILEAPQTVSPEVIAKKIIDTIAAPYQFASTKIDYVSPSIGISIYPTDAKDASSLVKHSDDAMYQAKVNRKSFCCYQDML